MCNNKKILKKKAQSFLEYSVVIACVAAAYLGLQIYLKRSLQGRLREASDQIGGQYAPKQAEAHSRTEIAPLIVNTDPKLIWLKYPPGAVDGNGDSIAGEYVKDEFDLPVFGIETTTELTENVDRSGNEEMDAFEAGLFD